MLLYVCPEVSPLRPWGGRLAYKAWVMNSPRFIFPFIEDTLLTVTVPTSPALLEVVYKKHTLWKKRRKCLAFNICSGTHQSQALGRLLNTFESLFPVVMVVLVKRST